MGWRQSFRQRARQGIPALLEVDALLQAHGVLAALPGARIAPGLVRFQLAAVTCEGLRGQGLAWLQGARQGRGALAGKVPRYRPWKAGADALAEIGIGGLPDAAVYGCSSFDRRHWLLLLPERAQLWLGWSG
ncbi:hypothetical protein JY452_01525 [Stenotrophomonas maltophilia]|uniref:hypothetical protein n=1 Tax=Stenotrophomonas TaxID=40323 RepID=UPI0006C306A2|nr:MULTISPECIES: hypothetical protein [Stenotrophomonas]KOO78317.1 hypothetical protein VO93_06905 [Stenotrophomonas maltophilia]MBN5124685.1 hypothetical protein [Stenotrophomonas maltophilia]MBN5175142.1 hypothetical protein [Stenotrophomonas maltophilia]MCU1120800.1 hypothetical protein [Stenotrophomonas maltophilia]MDQ7276032.1 hypothetical protein [Stenotrophomonas sp. Sm3147]